MSQLGDYLGHLKHHVPYPADKKQVVAACSNMSDFSESDRKWFTSNLPEGRYAGPGDVVNALLKKV